MFVSYLLPLLYGVVYFCFFLNCCENDLFAKGGIARFGPQPMKLNGYVPAVFINPGKISNPIRFELISLNPFISHFSATGRKFCSTAFRLFDNKISVNGIFTGQTSTHLPHNVEAKLKWEKSLKPLKKGVKTDPIGPLYVVS